MGRFFAYLQSHHVRVPATTLQGRSDKLSSSSSLSDGAYVPTHGSPHLTSLQCDLLADWIREHARACVCLTKPMLSNSAGHVTFLPIICADPSVSIHPAWVFSGKKFMQNYLRDSAAGCIGACNPKGSMNSEVDFFAVFCLFVEIF